jgi:hypothetical protein
MAKNKHIHSNQISYRIGYRRGRTATVDAVCKWLKAKNEMCMFELEMILGDNFIEDLKKAIGFRQM